MPTPTVGSTTRATGTSTGAPTAPKSPQILPSEFSAATREWFASVFAAPTSVQTEAWAAIARGEHALMVAPTGSGKTLSAFLSAIDKLSSRPGKEPTAGTTVVYVSPLKALGVDIERNLRAPLTGIRLAAERLGTPWTDISVGVRSGDTSSRERAALVRRPPDILITTPESLYLMLTSSARRTLAGVETVIIDEIHAVAGTKRGSHLALSLERLDALVGRDVQRVALSATVRPVERVASFLGGDRPVTVVAPPAHKKWDVTVRTTVEDLTDLSAGQDAEPDLLTMLSGPAKGQGSVWPFVEQELYERVLAGRSTLIFTNGRRTAERITGRLNEMWAAENDPESLPDLPARPPAQVMAPVDMVRGAPLVIARAHHGSVSKEQRAEIESALKSGELKCVVATSSLELGIDMGAVDRVIQVGAPPSVASALQRIGRAGHVVGATSVGDVFPLHRGELAPAVVATERMLAGDIEELRIPAHPLDVLAQQTVAATAAEGDDGLDVEEWFAAVTRSRPYADLDRSLLDSVIELLTGAYPSADFGNLRARLAMGDDGRLYPRPGALRLAATSGGTIPDRGMFGVFLAGADEAGARRVGELDEEMVHESRVGDVFTLGASSWRVEEITRDRVLVTPAPGNTGRLPFWRGEDEGRPVELGRHIGRLQREATREAARLEAPFIDTNTRSNLATYLAEQRAATGAVPDENTVVVERFRDELGDWRVVIHSPLGRQVLGAWSLVIADALSREVSVDATPVAGDDGIVLRLPDSELAERIPELMLVDPEDVRRIVVEQVGGTALFAARFRECAARALLLPRPNPGKRAPLWQQRQRSAQLLEVARHHPRFPIIIETIREVTQDAYDLPGLIELMRGLRSGAVRLVEVVTETPSPFAASLLFRYPGAFIYDGDTPLAERRAALLSIDPELLAAALGTLDLREVLDPDVIAEVVAELQHTAPTHRVDVDGVPALARELGPIPLDDLPEKLVHERIASVLRPAWLASSQRQAQEPELATELIASEERGARSDEGPPSGKLVPERRRGEARAPSGDEGPPDFLATSTEVTTLHLAGRPHVVAASDLGLLRDALGIPVPAGFSAPPTEGRDPLTQLIARYARTHGPFTATEVAQTFGLGVSTVELVLERERTARRLISGLFVAVPEPAAPDERGARQPSAVPEPAAPDEGGARLVEGRPGLPSTFTQFVDPTVLRRIRTRSLAKARSELEPVPQAGFARFLAASHHLDDRPASNADEVLLALQRLAGAALPASAWETHVLPARLRNYQRSHLDELLAEGEVVIRVRGSAGPNDPLIALVPHDDLDLLGPLAEAPGPDAETLAERLSRSDGTFASLKEAATAASAGAGDAPTNVAFAEAVVPTPSSAVELAEELWKAAEEGAVAPASMAPVRARVGGATRGAHKAQRPSPRRRARLPRPSRALLSGQGSLTPPQAAGRWYRVRDPQPSPADAALALASSWLERFGVITRGGVTADGTPGGFAAAYRLLARLEESGKMLRGYLVDGLGGAQFSTPEIIEQLRAHAAPSASVLRPAWLASSQRQAQEPQRAARPNAVPEPGARDEGAARPNAVPEPGARDEGAARRVEGPRNLHVLAALDPANPYGSILPWPAHATAHPSRAAGALVVLADGECIAHLTRGGRVLTLFGDEESGPIQAGLVVRALQQAVAEGRMERVRIEEIDGERVAASGLEAALLSAGAKLTPKGVVVEAPRA